MQWEDHGEWFSRRLIIGNKRSRENETKAQVHSLGILVSSGVRTEPLQKRSETEAKMMSVALAAICGN